jgi:thiol-disulfide isomerase/thioredoxin
MISVRIIQIFLVMIFFVVGCSEKKKNEGQDQPALELIRQKNLILQVDSINQPELVKLIKNRNGKILFINVWATWCEPCREEFPDIIRLSKLYNESELEVVGISVDFPDEINSKIIPFLLKTKVPFKIYVSDFKKDEDLINILNVKWNGALPATFIYDRMGIQRYMLIGKGTYNKFQNEIEKLE